MDINQLSNRLFHRHHFQGQHEDEQIIILARKHLFFLILSMVLPALILLACLAFPFVLSAGSVLDSTISQALRRPLLVVCLVLLPLMLVWIFFAYWEWENDLYILTNKRVISQKKVLRISEHWQEAELDKIQDIATTMPSILSHLMDYADLDIATASASSRLRFSKIPRPHLMKEAVLRQQEIVLGMERERQRQEMHLRLGEEFGYGPTASPSN